MAKSGQRRAYEDEAIQAQAPTEELRVTDRKAMDVTANIDAEYNRSGLYFNPDFFNSMAQISSTIHDVRRTSKFYEASLENAKTQQQDVALEKEHEQNAKHEANLYAHDMKMSWTEYLENKELEAKNSGRNLADMVPDLEYEFERRVSSAASKSPYVADQLTQYQTQTFPTFLSRAIQSDGQMNQGKALLRLQAYADITSNDIARGRVSLDSAINGMSDMILPLSQVAQVPGETALNNVYNQLLTNQVAVIEGSVKNGVLTVDQGKQALANLMVYYRERTITGKRDAEGTEESYKVWLSEDTLKTIQTEMGALDKYRAKVSTVGALEDYSKLIGYDTWKDFKDFSQAYYLSGTSLSKMRDDWWRMRTPVAEALAAGDSNAADVLYKMDSRYFLARTVKMAGELLNRTKNDPTTLANIKSALDHDLRLGLNAGQFRNVPSYLVLGDDTSILNLGFPSDADFEDFMRRSPVQDSDAMRYNYYQDLYKVLTSMTDLGATSDKIMMLDSDYAEYVSKVKDMLNPQALVSTDAQGHVVMNMEGVNSLAAAMSQGERIGMKANNGKYIGAPSTAVLDSFASQVNAMPPEIKAVAIRAYAEACVRAGNYGGIVDSMMNGSLSDNSKAVVKQASVYALLAPDASLRANIGNVSALQVSKTFTDLTVKGAANELKHHGFGNFADTLEQKMAQAHIPAEFKPAVRAAASQMYLAELEQHMSDKNYQGYKVDQSKLDKLISSNFRGGAYIHSSNLKGVNVDNLVNSATGARERVHTGLKRLGVKPGDVDTRINYKARAEEIYVNNQPLFLVGQGSSSLPGSGLKPFMLYFDNKPAAMPQGKYDSAHMALLTGATAIAGASDIRANSKMQDLLAKKGKGMNVETFEDLTYQLMNTAADPEVQKAWYEYFNSNFTNTQLVSAPDGLKDLLVDIYGQGFWENRKPGNQPGAMTRWQLNNYIDFLYTRMQNGKSARLDMAVTTYVQGRGVPLFEMRENMSKASRPWYISALKDDHSKYTPSGGISQHYYKKSIDMGLRGGFAQATFTTRNGVNIKREYLDSALNDVILPGVKAGYITSVGYNFYNLKNDPAFAKYRNMKNKQGQPLFVEYKDDNPNHFHLNLSEPWVDGKPTAQAPAGAQFITDTAHLIKTNVTGIYNNQDARACAKQGIHYTATADDAKRMGKSAQVLNSNAAYRAQAYANKFAYYRNEFKSTNFAVAAMAGCRFEIGVKGTPGRTGDDLRDYMTSDSPISTGIAISGMGRDPSRVGIKGAVGEGSLVPSSVKIPKGPLTADQAIRVMRALPYGSVNVTYYGPDYNKAQLAIDRWVKDGK